MHNRRWSDKAGAVEPTADDSANARECSVGGDWADLICDAEWAEKRYDDGVIYSLGLENGGRIAVLDRPTGSGRRDIESGYMGADNKFWLASGQCDIRVTDDVTTGGDAIAWIKQTAYTCVQI